MRNDAPFSYWKRPWHKWLILAAAVLQLLNLWLNLRQYRQVVAAGVFSAAEMASYAHDTALRCAFSGLLAACFFAVLSIPARDSAPPEACRRCSSWNSTSSIFSPPRR